MMNTIVRLLNLAPVALGLSCRSALYGALLLSFVIFAACSTADVYQTNDTRGVPTGAVESLAGYIPSSVTDVKLVFVHGVGDFCPGYALSGDDSGGWLNNKKAAKLGLSPIDPEPVTNGTIYSNEFLSAPDEPVHPADSTSYVALRTQRFSYGPTAVHVDAIEVTWSPLTQWIKNDMLADDFTEPGIVSCAENQADPVKKDGTVPKPPPRLVINRELKEKLLDRNLADAGIYMGQYHSVMQLGVADALCHALTGQAVVPGESDIPKPACDWSKTSVPPHTSYIFVTHSLGSRLLYDTLLGLMNFDSPGVDRAAIQKEFPGSVPYLQDVVSRTPVIYMMANQLTFLGMANITTDDTSTSVINKPAVVGLPGQQLQGQALATANVLAATQKAFKGCTDIYCRLRLAKEAALLVQASNPTDPPSRTLAMVAFSDTDDLLSWPVPSKYQRVVGDLDPLTFTNVYVRNATRWLRLFEWPPSAHAGYFTNDSVWQVIHCGAEKGHPKDC